MIHEFFRRFMKSRRESQLNRTVSADLSYQLKESVKHAAAATESVKNRVFQLERDLSCMIKAADRKPNEH